MDRVRFFAAGSGAFFLLAQYSQFHSSQKQAAEALKYTEETSTVILISDGKETCDLDPCKVGAELEKLGANLTVHVIGFDVKKPEDQAELKCLAENSGGLFFNAENAAELNEALAETAATPEPAPLPEAALQGRRVA